MTSEAQIAANRANAELSTGPKTVEGKAKSSGNARKHGLTARRLIARGEDFEAFETFCAEMAHALLPQDTYEATLVRRLALIAWRLDRICRVEAAMFDTSATLDVAFPNPYSPGGDGFPELIPNLARYESTLDRNFQRAMQLLERRQASRRREAEASLRAHEAEHPTMPNGETIPGRGMA